MKTLNILAAAACVALAGTAASSATVLNGSFENVTESLDTGGNDNPTWEIFYDGEVSNWKDNGNGIEIQTKDTLGLTPQHGDNYVELEPVNNTKISQKIQFDAGFYQLSFWFSPRTLVPRNTSDLQYKISGGVISKTRVRGRDHTVGEWSQIITNFSIATAGEYTLSFFGAGQDGTAPDCGNCGALLDNVSIAPVPLPASSLLLLAGLGGLATLRRKAK